MFLTSRINNHALTVVLGRWQLVEHVSYLMNTLPCSHRCHETMATDGACFIREGYHHDLTDVMGRWQVTEHDSNLRDKWSCSDRCHETMTTDGAFLPKVWNLLCRLSSSHDNGQSMVIQPLGMKHAPSAGSVLTVSWQWLEILIC